MGVLGTISPIPTLISKIIRVEQQLLRKALEQQLLRQAPDKIWKILPKFYRDCLLPEITI